MGDRFQKTFSVSVPVARAWRGFTDREELEAWFAPTVSAFDPRPGGRIAYGMSGHGEVQGEVLEVEPERRIRWTEGPGILPGPTEITVTFEAIDTGTRITVTHAGFGEGREWIDELQSHAEGWSQALADLILLLEHGVRHMRSHQWNCLVGVIVLEFPVGLKVIGVIPGSFADQVGLRPGDIMLELGGGAIYGRREYWLFLSEHTAGEEVEAVWAREGRVMSGRARLSERSPELIRREPDYGDQVDAAGNLR